MRVFIFLVNNYRDMWAKRSHLLYPLSALTSNKVKFKCIDIKQKVFDGIKRTAAHNTLLAYTDFNKRFDIHVDAITYQLGAVIN